MLQAGLAPLTENVHKQRIENPSALSLSCSKLIYQMLKCLAQLIWALKMDLNSLGISIHMGMSQ